MVQAPSLRINEDNFDKLFLIICMSIKCQLVRCRNRNDFYTYCENQLNDLLAIAMDLPDPESTENVIEGVRTRLFQYYDSLSNGEFSRIRYAILNLFRILQVPVSVLIQDGYQASNGIMLAPTSGPSLDLLGSAVVFNVEGKEARTYELPIAGKRIEDRQLELGRNRFSREAVQQRQLQQEYMQTAVAAERMTAIHSTRDLQLELSRKNSTRSRQAAPSDRYAAQDVESVAGSLFQRVETEKSISASPIDMIEKGPSKS
mmetsp:Transcript_6617/g.14140  ORF Transcript_6617/g.14140 Transcript_6617/m.14140 type:complete len:259 (-) Transcript_6617:881-1657(-)